jgi:hypothetical protein
MPEEEVAIMLWIDFNMTARRQLHVLTKLTPPLTQHASSVVVLRAVRVGSV